MELAYKILRRGGTTVSSGLSHPDKNFSIQHVDLVAGEKVIKGSFLGSCVPDRDIPAYIELYKSGRLEVDRLMSDHISLEQINQAKKEGFKCYQINHEDIGDNLPFRREVTNLAFN